MLEGIEHWQLSLGPRGFVGELIVTAVVIAVLMWLLFKNRAPVFWKKSDYFYLLFTLIGGVTAAADLAVNNWTKDLQQLRLNEGGN
jgi:hypothetical protein